MKLTFKPFASLTLSLVLAGSILAGCSGETATEENKESQTEQTDKQSSSEEKKDEQQSVETSTTAKQVTAYQSITAELNKAKEGEPVDWEHVSSLYQESLQNVVNEISGDYDTAIMAAIAAGQSGQLDANVARQLIDKTTQSYFYQKQKRLHKDVANHLEAGDEGQAKFAFAELKHLAQEVLIPTASKRDSYYGTDMVTQIENGLQIQEKALQEGNIEDFKVFKQLTDKSVYRSYYLAALSYAKKIEKAVGEGETDQVALQIKQAEAWGFFQAIKGSLSGGDEEAANRLNQLFSLNETDPSTITAKEVSDLFARAFIGKIMGYHEKTPGAMEAGEITEARTMALEGNVFMKAIQLVMIEKLGQDKTDATFEQAEKWFEAVSNENVEEANDLSQSVVEVLNEL